MSGLGRSRVSNLRRESVVALKAADFATTRRHERTYGVDVLRTGLGQNPKGS